jgi:hypothetical protein
LTSLSLQVSISEAMHAQFSPPSSLPAKSEFFLDRATGCRAAIRVRTRDNQDEKAFCRLRRREGGARPEAQAAEELA